MPSAAVVSLPPLERALHMLLACTSLPGFVTMVWRGMPTVWRGRQRLLCGWLLCIQAVHPGRTTLAEMARWTPAPVPAWRFGRVLQAAAWTGPRLVRWWAQERVATLPAPANGILSLVGAGRHADTRGPKKPVAQQGRLSQPHPWFLGLRCVLLRAAWDGERLPVGFRRLRPKRPAA